MGLANLQQVSASIMVVRILIVEDEPSVSSFLERALKQAGYDVTCSSNGIDGIQQAQTRLHDLILLDVMLPGKGGITICRELRAGGISTPIVFVSARGTLGDKVAGLDAGGDDYLPKPFQVAELLARVRANLRRTGAGPLKLTCGPLTIDSATRNATLNDKDLWLSPTEFALLELLVKNAGRTITRVAIVRHVWRQDLGGDDKVLDVYVSSLRKKLGNFGSAIKTVRGVGYRIQATETGA